MRFARFVGALLVLAAGGIHLWLYFDYFHVVHVIGVLFLLNAAAGIVLGVAIALSPRAIWVALGLAFGLATLAAFLVSVYHGLFGYTESLRGTWQEAAGLDELASAVLLTVLLRRRVQR
jgi:hypothetical protein